MEADIKLSTVTGRLPRDEWRPRRLRLFGLARRPRLPLWADRHMSVQIGPAPGQGQTAVGLAAESVLLAVVARMKPE